MEVGERAEGVGKRETERGKSRRKRSAQKNRSREAYGLTK